MLNDVADLRVRMEEYDEAENLLHRALKYARKSRGQNNWGEAMIMNNMAALYRDRGAYEEALNLYTEAFNLAKKYMNITHPGVAAIRNGQGVVLRHLGRYEEARAFHKIALTNILAAAGERSPELATVLFNIGLLEKTAGNLAIAEEKFLETIKIRKKIFGRNHQFVADTMDEYAAVLWDQGKYDESNFVKNEAEDIRNMVQKQLKDTVY